MVQAEQNMTEFGSENENTRCFEVKMAKNVMVGHFLALFASIFIVYG